MAAAHAQLQPGMVLVEINGQDMRGRTLEDGEAAFRAAGRPVRLAFAYPPEPEPELEPEPEPEPSRGRGTSRRSQPDRD